MVLRGSEIRAGVFRLERPFPFAAQSANAFSRSSLLSLSAIQSIAP